jgi:hypothetical protein
MSTDANANALGTRIKDSVLRGLGWVMLVFVLPNLLLLLLYYVYFRPKSNKLLPETNSNPNRSHEPSDGTVTADKETGLVVQEDPLPFLTAIRYQAHRARLEEIDSLSVMELTLRKNKIDVMLYFLETKPELLPRQERLLLTEQLQNQLALVETWGRAKRDAFADEFHRFKSRVLQLQGQQRRARITEVE